MRKHRSKPQSTTAQLRAQVFEVPEAGGRKNRSQKQAAEKMHYWSGSSEEILDKKEAGAQIEENKTKKHIATAARPSSSWPYSTPSSLYISSATRSPMTKEGLRKERNYEKGMLKYKEGMTDKGLGRNMLR